jgi:hypothetical protein
MPKARTRRSRPTNPIQAENDYDELREAVRSMISSFAEANDISHAILAPMLVDLAVDSCGLEYMYMTKKPTPAGLRQVFERFRRDTSDFIGATQKDAEAFIAMFQIACQLAGALDPDIGEDAA